MSNRKPVLMEQQMAVMAYLEDLLSEVPDTLVEEKTENIVEAFPCHQETVELPQPVEEAQVEDPLAGEMQSEVAEVTGEKAENESAVPQIPVWAEHEFQCLLFNVAGVTLAVPLVNLNGVIPWSHELTPMPGHSLAFLGLLRHLDKNVQVMDTAQVILPPAQRANAPAAEKRVEKILLMDEGRWGLACDEIGEVITLKQKDVRWRTAEGRRCWLAGTVSERLCALLDTDALAEMLVEGEPG